MIKQQLIFRLAPLTRSSGDLLSGFRVLSFLLCLICFSYSTASHIFAERSEEDIVNWLEATAPIDERISLSEAALLLSKTIYPEVDVKKYTERLDRMAEDIKKQLRKEPQPEEIITAINQYLYQEKGARVAPIEIGDRMDKFMLSKVMDSMQGNCLGFSTLYYCLAERLELPLSAVVIPQHVFLCYENRGKISRNIEPTSNGAEISNDEYIERTKKLIGDTIPKYSYPKKITFRKISKKQFVALILYNRAVDYFRHGHSWPAIKDFSQSLRIDPNHAETYKSRGSLYLEQKVYNKAAEDLKKADELEPDCPQTLYNLGAAYFSQAQIISGLDPDVTSENDALKCFEKTIKLAPDYTEAYYSRGLIYHRQENDRLALEDFTQAIKLNPNHSTSYLGRAMAYFSLDVLDRALIDLNKSISLDNSSADAYNNRGVIHAKQENWEEALSDFQQAVNLDANLTDAYHNLAITYYKMKRYAEALPHAKKYLTLIPDDHPKRQEAQELHQALKRLIK
ncbi:MAG: tetratricopeptide repeat protein [Planctomycetota bacterium]